MASIADCLPSPLTSRRSAADRVRHARSVILLPGAGSWSRTGRRAGQRRGGQRTGPRRTAPARRPAPGRRGPVRHQRAAGTRPAGDRGHRRRARAGLRQPAPPPTGTWFPLPGRSLPVPRSRVIATVHTHPTAAQAGGHHAPPSVPGPAVTGSDRPSSAPASHSRPYRRIRAAWAVGDRVYDRAQIVQFFAHCPSGVPRCDSSPGIAGHWLAGVRRAPDSGAGHGQRARERAVRRGAAGVTLSDKRRGSHGAIWRAPFRSRDPVRAEGRLDGGGVQYLMRKFPMRVILLPSGSVMADSCTSLFTVSTGPGAMPLPERSAMC